MRKIDLRVMLYACIMFMALELDRANIQQANNDDLLTDLNLTTIGKFWAYSTGDFASAHDRRLQHG